MNVRHHLECEVCQKVTLVRTQIGHLDQHPLKIHCGNCGILMEGTAYMDQENASFEFDFTNATLVDKEPDYYIEASGELLTEKLQEYKEFYMLAPFFNSLRAMGENILPEFISKTKEFLYLCENDWGTVKRINDLWHLKKYTYLKKEIHKYLPQKQFPMNNELEILRGVHQFDIIFFNNVVDKNFFDEISKFIFEEINHLSKNKIKKLFELALEFEELLPIYEKSIFKIKEQFVNIFKHLIPVYGVQFYSEEAKKNINNKGITTVSFEDLKQFYLDSFEVAGDLIRLVIAYNNLKYRNNYKNMKEKRKDIKKISDFDKKSKGIRITFINGDEKFDNLVVSDLDNQLRNAIGHNSYEYDGAKQVLKYFPKGLDKQDNYKEISLLEFAQNCLFIFHSIFNLSELLYQTRKIVFLSKGNKPVNPSVFKQKKVGRNELCPCGSGKKYKKCCGK